MLRNKPGRQSRRRFAPSSKTHVAIAAGLVMSLFAAWTMLAYSGVVDSAFRLERSTRQTASPASLNSNSPSKEYIYAGSRLVATEEPSGCSGSITASNNLTATASSASAVSVVWTAFTGPVHHYEVERRTTGSFATVIFNVQPASPTVSVSDTNLSSNTACLYRVRAFDSANCPSEFSNIDLATTTIFAEDPLQSQVTIIKAVHVTQLRQAVDAVRVTANIGPAIWTNPLDQVKAVHFSELRAKLNEALVPLNLSEMPIDPAIAPTNTVFAAHLQAVREKVK